MIYFCNVEIFEFYSFIDQGGLKSVL